MDVAGERASAHRFHVWVANAVMRIEPDIRALLAARGEGRAIDHDRMPPARFTLDGLVEEDGWPNFQIDGYGQWLWSLGGHVKRIAPANGSSESFSTEIRHAGELVAEYLEAFWDEPCYDAWEEGRTQLHTSTLASACAGLRAATEMIDLRYATTAEEVWSFIRERCVTDGHFGKSVRNGSVDASLLWLASPFGLVGEDDPVFRRTIERIERDLVSGGGVLRYPDDTFYGGGAWILLTAWLAWHHARNGRPERAQPYLAWIERQRDRDGGLPEQVSVDETDAWFSRYWTDRWGPSAHPLLWSHAMVILAAAEMSDR
jgi:GH15 family glucan-1,4-alpha-glucosidase